MDKSLVKKFFALSVGRPGEAEGSLALAEVLPEYVDIESTPHIPVVNSDDTLDSLWTIAIDQYEVDGVPLDAPPIFAAVDPSQEVDYLPAHIVHSIYGPSPHSIFVPEQGMYYVDCFQPINIALSIGGVRYEINPLDLVHPVITEIHGSEYTVCVNSLRIAPTASEHCFGAAMLRNFYSKFNLGDDSVGPTLQLLGLTDAAAVEDQFLSTRTRVLANYPNVIRFSKLRHLLSGHSHHQSSSHTFHKRQEISANTTESSTPSTTSSSSSDNATKLLNFAFIAIGLLGVNTILAIVLIIIGILLIRKQKGSKSKRNADTVKEFSGGYQPVGAEEQRSPTPRIVNNKPDERARIDSGVSMSEFSRQSLYNIDEAMPRGSIISAAGTAVGVPPSKSDLSSKGDYTRNSLISVPSPTATEFPRNSIALTNMGSPTECPSRPQLSPQESRERKGSSPSPLNRSFTADEMPPPASPSISITHAMQNPMNAPIPMDLPPSMNSQPGERPRSAMIMPPPSMSMLAERPRSAMFSNSPAAANVKFVPPSMAMAEGQSAIIVNTSRSSPLMSPTELEPPMMPVQAVERPRSPVVNPPPMVESPRSAVPNDPFSDLPPPRPTRLNPGNTERPMSAVNFSRPAPSPTSSMNGGMLSPMDYPRPAFNIPGERPRSAIMSPQEADFRRPNFNPHANRPHSSINFSG